MQVNDSPSHVPETFRVYVFPLETLHSSLNVTTDVPVLLQEATNTLPDQSSILMLMLFPTLIYLTSHVAVVELNESVGTAAATRDSAANAVVDNNTIVRQIIIKEKRRNIKNTSFRCFKYKRKEVNFWD